MKKFYFLKTTLSIFIIGVSLFFCLQIKAQNCSLLTATFKSYESRCASTGSIKVTATGGSGSYKYKATGPVVTNFTSTDSITGLSAGTYTIEVNDIVTNCSFKVNNIVVLGSYLDPRFTLSGTDVTCEGVANGTISLNNQQDGRGPFLYSIAPPSPMGVGTSNTTGSFNNLIAGDYSIRLTDSCGGIQTRVVTIHDYTWWIDSYSFTKISCQMAQGFIKAVDSKGNISTVGGIPGFMYGIIRQPGDTLWFASPNITADITGLSSFQVAVKDNCGKVKTGNASIDSSPSLGNSVTISNKTCDKFSASVTGMKNFFNPSFCLYKDSVSIACNTTGVFNNVPYGYYCIIAIEVCTNTSFTRCFTVTPPTLSIGNSVSITKKTCVDFTASITGQVGLTNPNYCLYNSSNTLITCNSTGVFNNLAYGNYSIQTKDGCRDTTITRFFSASRPIPKFYPVTTPSYTTCNNFGVLVKGDSLTSPSFCLYDSVGNLIICNTTGKFDSLAFGNYCAKVYDACLDSTYTTCFTGKASTINNDITVSVVNTGCNLFTATVKSNQLKNAFYSLYNSSNALVGSNNTGIFLNLVPDLYHVSCKNPCPDTTITVFFNILPLIPSVNASVQLSNYACATFQASITNPVNLTTPQYCVYDTSDVLLTCNTTGVFPNLNYGSYTIKIKNSCYDTTIIRNFTATYTPITLAVTANTSCVYGYSKFDVTISNAQLPINIKVYNALGNLLYNNYYTASVISIDSMPGIVTGQTYKFIATDSCGRKDSVNVNPTNSSLTHSAISLAKCPGSIWPNGSGKIVADVATNMGSLTVTIIKKDNILLSPQIIPSIVAGSLYTFDDLGPATYILSYKANDACNRYIYDTVVVNPYIFPNLQKSTAYQCDVDGFTVGAVATNGVGPFSYSIIGSSPDTPSIIAGPQINPLFNINNGTSYSLIRLRALDACGNATLGDASILPLANNKIVSTENCFLQPTTLTVDPFDNATYEWYKKDSINSTDSVLISTGSYSTFIPTVLPADTGVYICHISIGTCVNRTYVYHLDGSCYSVLPAASLDFSGNLVNDEILLRWKAIDQKNNLKEYVVERKSSDNTFGDIGRVTPLNLENYYFTDTRPEIGNNFYRLRLIKKDNTFIYSNIITINKANVLNGILVFPNPATDFFTIDFGTPFNHLYKIKLMNLNNQVVSEQTFSGSTGKKLEIHRNKAISNGIYILRVFDSNTNQEFVQKIILR